MSSSCDVSHVMSVFLVISTLLTATHSYPTRGPLILDTQQQFTPQQQQQHITRAPSTWSSVFIPSEFNIYNSRRVSSSSSLPSMSSIQFTNSIQNFESNFNLLNSVPVEVKTEETVEDVFLNAIDDISRGTRCHSSHLHKGKCGDESPCAGVWASV